MRKTAVVICVIVVLLLQIVAVSALSASEAKQDWKDAKELTRQAKEEHAEAKLDFANDKSPENEQKVVDTGKQVMYYALNEAELWLVWKDTEAKENPDVPDDIQESIEADVEKNKEKIDDLRTDVDNINNRLGMGVVFLKMVGKYFELLTDVARNSGKMWVHIGNEKADKIAEYEEKLRVSAGDDGDVLEKLDMAKDELEIARRNLDNAEDTYEQVKMPGTPRLKFAEANNYMRSARMNLLGAFGHLNSAYHMIVSRGE